MKQMLNGVQLFVTSKQFQYECSVLAEIGAVLVLFFSWHHEPLSLRIFQMLWCALWMPFWCCWTNGSATANDRLLWTFYLFILFHVLGKHKQLLQNQVRRWMA